MKLGQLSLIGYRESQNIYYFDLFYLYITQVSFIIS